MNNNLGFNLGAEGYQHLRRDLSEDERKLVSKVFYMCDADFKGYLSREDIKVAFIELFGFKPCKSEVDSLILRYGGTQTDDGPHHGLTLEEFTTAMSSKMAEQDEDEVIRETFLAFDTHCRGFLIREDVQRIFSKVAPHLPPVTVDTAFREIDQDADGRVSFRDFQMMMKYDFECHI
ncbi:EF-hand calcium-binding domain-containing protein 11-like [Liolophura sinensis]|uniref:EF-hand calcium-binding domain-containing protein 11-like n=1 Tax=Liolophura sinensis TaxID=3198878 RepID=UPI00315949B5